MPSCLPVALFRQATPRNSADCQLTSAGHGASACIGVHLWFHHLTWCRRRNRARKWNHRCTPMATATGMCEINPAHRCQPMNVGSGRSPVGQCPVQKGSVHAALCCTGSENHPLSLLRKLSFVQCATVVVAGHCAPSARRLECTSTSRTVNIIRSYCEPCWSEPHPGRHSVVAAGTACCRGHTCNAGALTFHSFFNTEKVRRTLCSRRGRCASCRTVDRSGDRVGDRGTGPGLLESVYELRLCLELADADIAFAGQVTVPVFYQDAH